VVTLFPSFFSFLFPPAIEGMGREKLLFFSFPGFRGLLE